MNFLQQSDAKYNSTFTFATGSSKNENKYKILPQKEMKHISFHTVSGSFSHLKPDV